ncbi:MAG: hypothetical protein ABEL76_04370 [Bradymonadaceae bacterium]
MLQWVHNAGRLFLMAAAFSIAFLLTPRAWVSEQSPDQRTERVPVNQLDQAESCLWCNSPKALDSSDCRAEDDDRMWLNPDEPRRSEDCEDEAGPTS